MVSTHKEEETVYTKIICTLIQDDFKSGAAFKIYKKNST